MDIKHRVGLRIKTIRKRRKLSQQELAENVDRSVDTISHLERGVSLPGVETLLRLSDELEVPILELLDLDGNDGVSKKRSLLLATITDVARSLTDNDLALAVMQMEALATARLAKD
jgi:transcriptional regulator with XRE-family HTH domain